MISRIVYIICFLFFVLVLNNQKLIMVHDAYYAGCLSNTTKCESNGSCAWPSDTCSKQADLYMKELKEK